MSTVQDPAGAGEANVVDIDTPVIAGKKALAVVVAGSPAATPPSNLTATGNISALGGTVALAAQGWSSCGVVLTGTWVGKLQLETSCDGGTTWAITLIASAPETAAPLPAILPTMQTNGTYQAVALGSITNVRVRADEWTSGTASVRIVLGDSTATPRFTMFQQSVALSQFNNTTSNLAVGASFTGATESTLGIAGIQINAAADQPLQINVQQSTDGTNWDIDDELLVFPSEGTGRTFQATGAYFRIIVTNVGSATTTGLRVQVAMCPVVEALPRALTEYGKVALVTPQTSWEPDDGNFNESSKNADLFASADGSLNTWSTVLTDASSYRDDFPGTALHTVLSGTVYVRNGSKLVSGSGTSFLSLKTSQKIRLSAHADSAYAKIADVHSDTFLELEEEYTGATGNGEARVISWIPTTGTGTSITVGSSILNLLSGTTSGQAAMVRRIGDYPPLTATFYAALSQRIANQEAILGLVDDADSPIDQALVVFDGTTNTTVKFRTSSDATASQETTVTLPYSGVTSGYHTYVIDVIPGRAILFIDDVKVAEHKLHTPGPYATMDPTARIKNTGTAGSTTTFSFDFIHLANYNRVEVATQPKGDPLATKEVRASVATASNVSAAVADTVLLAANANRLGFMVFNDSTAVCYLKFGIGASTTSFTVKMAPGGYYEDAYGYTGRVNAYWSAANGAARITEVT